MTKGKRQWKKKACGENEKQIEYYPQYLCSKVGLSLKASSQLAVYIDTGAETTKTYYYYYFYPLFGIK